MPDASQSVVILGSTGSIGVSSLDVAAALPDRIHVFGLVANHRWQDLAEQCQRFRPKIAIISDPESYRQADLKQFPAATRVLTGEVALQELVASPEVDLVVSAIVGAAGIQGTWCAVEAGKRVALANKESMVVAGPLLTELAVARKATILPVDSEHSAIFQALAGHSVADVERVVLTASGGPFRGRKREDLEEITPEDALKHPTWTMGRKITIDSATLMNKALEVIEARWLFGLAPSQIDVIVHPESIVHSFVEYKDGSVLAQLSPPDMRLPIQYAIVYPERLPGPSRKLPWNELRQLRFEPPDRETFEALDLGFEVARMAGTSGAVLNAANEAAVARFLDRQIGFLDIARTCRDVLNAHHYEPKPTLERLLALDQWARQEVARWNPSRTPNR